MKIRTRLTLQFTVIVALLVIIFSFTIYNFFAEHRKNEFYSRLEKTAVTTAKLYSKDVIEIDTTLLKIFDQNSLSSSLDENVSIYSREGALLYHSSEDNYLATPKEMIDRIAQNKEMHYTRGNKEVLGLLYTDTYGESYIVIASAHDTYGFSKLGFLRKILTIGVLITIGIIIILGLFFAKQALSPISNVIEQASEITGSNLTQRIYEGNGKDEIAQLARTFNNMLERIQKTFELQKSFVANSSHELRTPLTSITGQLEVVLMNPREPDEYRRVLNSVLDDIKNVNRLANGLLELAHADMDITRLDMNKIRVDELLWQSRTDLVNREPQYKINIEISDIQDDDQNLIVFGDKYLLASAIFNVMENACKFSDNSQVNVNLMAADGAVRISFLNRGIGISQEDLKKIGEPFYRGVNAKGIEGHGIGLSLVLKIISQHFGRVYINSTSNESTEVIIYLPTFRTIVDNAFD